MRRFVVMLNAVVGECSGHDSTKFASSGIRVLRLSVQGESAADAVSEVQEALQRLVRNSW